MKRRQFLKSIPAVAVAACVPKLAQAERSNGLYVASCFQTEGYRFGDFPMSGRTMKVSLDNFAAQIGDAIKVTDNFGEALFRVTKIEADSFTMTEELTS